MTESQPGRTASPFRIPHTLALMFIMMVVALVLTWICRPANSKPWSTNPDGKSWCRAPTTRWKTPKR